MRGRVDPKDIVGHMFGRLTVTQYDGYYDLTGSGRKNHWYLCACDCGNSYLARRDHLLMGRVKSCGSCRKIINEGKWMRYITSKGDSFIFDKEDYGLACANSWCITQKTLKERNRNTLLPVGKMDAAFCSPE